MFNEWLLLLILPHSPPASAPHHYHLFLQPLSCDTVVFTFSLWRYLVLRFLQVEVWFLTRPLVHPTAFTFFWPIEQWAEGLVAPMEWSLQLLYWYLTLFARHWGPLGSLAFF